MEGHLAEWLEIEVLHNTVLDWGLALLMFLVTFTVLPIARGYFTSKSKKAASAEHSWAPELALELLRRTTRLFMWALAVWLAVFLLTLPSRADRIITTLMLLIFWMQAAVWGVGAASYFINRRRVAAAGKGMTSSLNIADFVARLLIWALMLLLALDNLGVNITALVAGLGIGGIAIALAVQTVLGDLLASLAIALDKPFIVGDFLVVGADMGTVEKIGIKSTRLRALSGEQINFSNADLLGSRVHNFGRMYERRAVFTLNVSVETSREQLRKIPEICKAAVLEHDKVRFDRAHFKEFGGSSLVFEVVYIVLDADMTLYMDIQQEINLRILEEFEKHDIRFAFAATQKIVLSRAAIDATEQSGG